MTDVAIGTAGLSLTLLGWGLTIMAPNLSKKWGAAAVGGGLILLVIAAVMFCLPSGVHTPPHGGLTASNNHGIVTQGQTGGVNIARPDPIVKR